MDVARISFSLLKSYWIEVDHFKDPDKNIRELVRRLGPYVSELSDPRRFSYGLYDNEKLVGVTHLVQWSDALVRYRTLNVLQSHRGRDLGAFLLGSAIKLDWRGLDHDLFGWIRREHQPWALNHGFMPLDGTWHDDHIAMTKPLGDF